MNTKIDRFIRALAGDATPEERAQLTDPESDLGRLLHASRAVCSTVASPTAEELLRRVADFWSVVDREARARAGQRLSIQVAELREKFRATSAWLFEKRGHDLEATVTHNTRKRHLVMAIGERGIVPHVAETAIGYCTNDVKADPNFVRCIEETQSELAVPVKTLDGTVVGVLNLESRHPDTFRPAQIEELQVAAAALVPHLLVLSSPGECRWHPEVHGWDLSEIFQRFCHVVAEVLNGSDSEDTTAVTIWSPDWAKQEVFASATNGYDIEYINELTLHMESFTGQVASSPRGTVWDTTPEKAPGFCRYDKADQSGMRRILAAPIYLPSNSPTDGGAATLNVYFFSERTESLTSLHGVIRQLSEEIGRIIADYRTQRVRLATAYLKQQLLNQSLSSEAALQTIESFLKSVFQADGCSIFACQPDQRRLVCVATTGLDDAGAPASWGESSGLATRMPYYDLDKDPGFTTYLALHCGIPARKNDVLSETEQGLPEGFPSKPLNKFREKFARSETDHRRFLGIGVGLPHESLCREEAVLGVLRLNRASDSRPFTWDDESLLKEIAALELCKKAFLDWRARTILDPLPTRTTFPTLSSEPKVIAAVANFLRPVPALASTARLTDELLQSLTAMFAEHRVYGAALMLADRQGHEPNLRRHGYHSEHHKGPRDTFADEECTIARPEFWLAEAAPHVVRDQLFLQRTIMTFNHGPIYSKEGHKILSEAWVPVVAWHGRHLLEGVVALSFQREISTWSPNECDLLFHASSKLSAILSSTPHVIRPECFQLAAAVALDRFAAFPRKEPAIRADWTELRLRYSDELETVARQGSHTSAAPDVWQPVKTGPMSGEEASGIQERADLRAISFPLRLGPSEIGDIRCGFAQGDCQRQRDELLRTLPGLWSRLTFSMSKFWKVSFTPKKVAPGITAWKADLTLDRISPELSRPQTLNGPSLVADFRGSRAG